MKQFNPFTEQSAGPYFVGREDQLDLFHRALNGLAEGSPRHFFIAGLHGTGKTSYLSKLVDIAKAEGFLGALATLDPGLSARQHVATVIRAAIESLDAARTAAGGHEGVLMSDWDAGEQNSRFHFNRTDRLEGDDLRRDFSKLAQLAKEPSCHLNGLVICIDEAQRVDPVALSALKNSLQHINSFLVIPSIRLVDDAGGAVAAGRNHLDLKAAEAEGDHGASRFFVTGAALGPFAGDGEVRSCIERRLQGNVLQFGPDVISMISAITGRMPRDVISFSSLVYDLCAENSTPVATTAELDLAFRGAYKSRVAEAGAFTASLPGAAMEALKKLIDIGKPSSAGDLAAAMYPAGSVNALQTMAGGIRAEFLAICESTFVSVSDDQYRFKDSISRYALQLALAAS